MNKKELKQELVEFWSEDELDRAIFGFKIYGRTNAGIIKKFVKNELKTEIAQMSLEDKINFVVENWTETK